MSEQPLKTTFLTEVSTAVRSLLQSIFDITVEVPSRVPDQTVFPKRSSTTWSYPVREPREARHQHEVDFRCGVNICGHMPPLFQHGFDGQISTRLCLVHGLISPMKYPR